jgi:hypothetical protein
LIFQELVELSPSRFQGAPPIQISVDRPIAKVSGNDYTAGNFGGGRKKEIQLLMKSEGEFFS